MPKVFITNRSTHDYTPAKAYGSLVFLTDGKVRSLDFNKNARQLIKRLNGISEDDYIICTALPSLNWLLGYIMGRCGLRKINILHYHNHQYFEARLDLSNLEAIAPQNLQTLFEEAANAARSNRD